MNYPYLVKMHGVEYVFKKAYKHFALYKNLKQGWCECFTPFDLGLASLGGKPNDN